MKSMYGKWVRFGNVGIAKPKSKTGGARRRSWAHQSRNAYKSVCFVTTRNDNTSEHQ